MTKKAKQSSFEDALNELEALVEEMESGDLSLDQSLAAFEKGVAQIGRASCRERV